MAAPTVATTAATDIGDTTASSGGTLQSDGGSPLTAYGVCWNTSGAPTIADARTVDGPISGAGTGAASIGPVQCGGVGTASPLSFIGPGVLTTKPVSISGVGTTGSAVASGSGSLTVMAVRLTGSGGWSSGAYVNASSYGTTEAALDAAAAVAVSEGKSLYLPAAVYTISDWAPPANLTFFGDGDSSHLDGMVRWRAGQTWRDLMIGSKTTVGAGPYYSTGTWTHQDVTFNGCKFRGGGSGNPTINVPAQGWGSQAIRLYDHTFHDCEFECNYQTAYSQAAQDVSWFIRREYGDISDNIVFEGCRFGTLNEQSRTGGIFGGVVVWSSWHADDDGPYGNCLEIGDHAAGYYDNFYFSACIFERADIWNLDMSGFQWNPTGYTENTVFVTDCVFKGLSGAYHPEYTTRIGAQEEPGHDSIWARNIFGISYQNALKFTKASSRSQAYDNVFDYRTYADTINQQNGQSMIDTLYSSGKTIIRIDSSETGIVCRDNELLLPSGKYTGMTQQGWIYNQGSGNTVTGNSVSWGSGTGPLAAY